MFYVRDEKKARTDMLKRKYHRLNHACTFNIPVIDEVRIGVTYFWNYCECGKRKPNGCL